MPDPRTAAHHLHTFLQATVRLEDAMRLHRIPCSTAAPWWRAQVQEPGSFSCPALDTIPSAHTALTLRPLQTHAHATWAQCSRALLACAPILHAMRVQLCAHALDTTSPSETQVRMGQEDVFFARHPALIQAMEGYLHAIHAMPVGRATFTITGNIPAPNGGFVTPITRTVQAPSAEDAARLWCAGHAFTGRAYPITSITQSHDVAAQINDSKRAIGLP